MVYQEEEGPSQEEMGVAPESPPTSSPPETQPATAPPEETPPERMENGPAANLDALRERLNNATEVPLSTEDKGDTKGTFNEYGELVNEVPEEE